MTALDDLAQRARDLVAGPGRAVLGITGPPAAGKSTLVEHLLDVLPGTPPPGLPAGSWVAHVPMDGFHLADAALDRLGRRSRKGAPDTFDVGGYAATLSRIVADTGDVVYAPAFERTLEQPVAGSIAVPPEARLVLTEGNYLLLDDPGWRRVRALLAQTWYLDLDDAQRLPRLVRRHEEFGKAPDEAAAWTAAVDGPNAALVAATRDAADLVVPSAVIATLGG